MKCKYCNLSAGFFRWKHKECEEKHDNAVKEITKIVDEAFEVSLLDDSIYERVSRIGSDGYVGQEELHSLLFKVVKSNLNNKRNMDGEFVLSFVGFLPNDVRDKLQNDKSYLRYWKDKLEEDLSDITATGQLKREVADEFVNLLEVNSSSLRKTIINVALSGLSRKINLCLSDGLIEKDEEDSIANYIQQNKLVDTTELYYNASYVRLQQALVIRDLQEGKKPDISAKRYETTGIPIILGKNEYIIWAFYGVHGYEEKTGKRYTGQSRGVSYRICKGVYYRTGGTKGHIETYQYHDDLGRDTLVVTNKNIIFCGKKIVKIPVGKVISYKGYSDGVELIKDAATPKSYLFSGCDPWFIINAIQVLAS